MYATKSETLLQPYDDCFVSLLPYRVNYKASWKLLQSQVEGEFELHQRSDGKSTRRSSSLKFQSAHLTKKRTRNKLTRFCELKLIANSMYRNYSAHVFWTFLDENLIWKAVYQTL